MRKWDDADDGDVMRKWDDADDGDVMRKWDDAGDGDVMRKWDDAGDGDVMRKWDDADDDDVMRKWDDAGDGDVMMMNVSAWIQAAHICTCSSKYASADTGLFFVIHAYWKMSFMVMTSSVWIARRSCWLRILYLAFSRNDLERVGHLDHWAAAADWWCKGIVESVKHAITTNISGHIWSTQSCVRCIVTVFTKRCWGFRVPDGSGLPVVGCAQLGTGFSALHSASEMLLWSRPTSVTRNCIVSTTCDFCCICVII